MVVLVEMEPVVDLEGDAAGPARTTGTGLAHESITDKTSHQVVATLQRCGDPVVGGRVQQGDLRAAVFEELVGIVPGPVLLDDGAVPEVLDTATARGHPLPERPGFGNQTQQPVPHMHSLLHRGAQVRGPKRDHMVHVLGPRLP